MSSKEIKEQKEFDFECPECGEQLTLERDKDNPNELVGWCVWCHLDIFISYDEWKNGIKSNSGKKM